MNDKIDDGGQAFEQKSIGRENAIKMAETGWWNNCEPKPAFIFQMRTRELCMPFGEFHRLAELALGRSVWTHEFAYPDSLISELKGETNAPTMNDILNLIPAEKRIIINADAMIEARKKGRE